jgi:transcriptional regulator with XRE-family HTH domain
MTARKKTPRKRKAAGGRGRTKTGRKAVPSRKAKKAPGNKRTGRTATGSTGRGKPARRTVATRAASLAERLSELVEHAAAGALRRVVDSGGREIAGWLPEASELRQEAGAYLRELRELAGLTTEELAEAAELRDRSLIEAVEAGTATLSFELILRLAAILARHDPVPFISRLVRSYNPVLWQLLEDWGVGRLPLQIAREWEFVNILRSHDDARTLGDEDFAQVLEFTRAAFETALHFASRSGRGGRA